MLGAVSKAKGDLKGARAALNAANGIPARPGDVAPAANPANASVASDDVAGKTKILQEKWAHRAFLLNIFVIGLAFLVGIIYILTGSNKCANPASCTPVDTGRVAFPWALIITAAVFLVASLVSTGWSAGGLVAYIVGKDNRLSTSKTQVGLWTIVIAFTFVFFTLELVNTKDSKTLTTSFAHFGPEYLILLGGPFAAAVLAQATTASSTANGSVQQVPAAVPTAGDLVTDQDGQPAIADAQFFLFNVVGLVFFVVALAYHPDSLPNLPATLVGLTGVSALTYLGAKVVSTNPPTITTVTISSEPSNGFVHTGDTIRITGSGLNPPGNEAENLNAVAVVFNSIEVQPQPGFSDTQMDVLVPVGVANRPGSTLSIAVRTAAGVLTTAYTGLTAAAPAVLSAAADGAVLSLAGFGLAATVDAPGRLHVTVSSTPTIAGLRVAKVERLPGAAGITLTLDPAPPPGSDVAATVTVDGMPAGSATATFA